LPTYSYRCANCGYAFDQYQAFTDDSLTVCPNCGEPQLRKVFNNIGVTFNGSGFYRTDSRSGSSASDSPAPAKSDAAPKSDGGSKPATPAPTPSTPKKSDSGSASS
jgi:putative FmdB family regulatory protein